MNFLTECLDNFVEIVTKKYCLFSGRARRREYWEYVLVETVIGMILGLIDNALHLHIGDNAGVLSTLASLVLLLPGLGLSVRRLHDIGREWYWLLIAFIPIAGAIWLLVLTCKEGDRGPNDFGPDPKDVFVPAAGGPAGEA
ncbi:MAG: DUF805 domain-containing protein [Abditibacteriota bacterium]|nr:DUF805 domain-containing protein [Abditibacteriota bacterium]